MGSAIKNFLMVTMGLVICLFIAWLYLKAKANSAPIRKPVAQEFFSEGASPLNIVYGGVDSQKPNTLSSFVAAHQLSPGTVFWVDLQITKDGVVVAARDREYKNPLFAAEPKSPEQGPPVVWIRHLNWTDVEKITPPIPKLETLLAKFPERRFILNIVDYPEQGDKILEAVVVKANAGKRVIIQSEQDGALHDIRKLQPLWLYGTSRAQIVQTLFLANLALAPLAPLTGDVLITPISAQGVKLVTDDLLTEARRRSMKVLVGPLVNGENAELERIKPDGIIVTNSR